MSFDISRTLFSSLSSDGVVFNEGIFRSIKATYQRYALEMVEQYNNDAIFNGLRFDRYKEERIIDQLSRNIYQAGVSYLNNPNQTPVMPGWKRVINSIPDVMKEFLTVVEEDNQ